jgi:plastocyanin
MLEDGKKMLFEPAVVDVRLGEQVRFEIFNEGS